MLEHLIAPFADTRGSDVNETMSSSTLKGFEGAMRYSHRSYAVLALSTHIIAFPTVSF